MSKICFAPGQFEFRWEYGELDFRKYSCMCFHLESVGTFIVFFSEIHPWDVSC